jgi:tetratricopeptide (TPR) repeat protein
MLPPGTPGALPSIPVAIRKGIVREDTVAVVAPNGVLLFFALADGAYLGERRTPDGLLPWIEGLRIRPPAANQPDVALANAADTLLVASRDAHLVALGLDRLPRRRRGRRKAIREQLRRIALGEPFVSRAVSDLNLLLSGGNEVAVYLALAEAQMALGKPADALVAVKQVLNVDPQRPQALRLRVLATFALTKDFDSVEPLLVELGRIDSILAARAAVELSDVSREGQSIRRFLTLATRLAPVYGSRAHRRLGSFRLRFLASRLPENEKKWRQVARNDQLVEDILEVIEEVRRDFVISLSQEEDAFARAAALIVTVLELRIASKIMRNGTPRTNRLKRGHSQLSGLRTTQQLATTIPPLLRNARRLAEGCVSEQPMKASDAAEILRALGRDRPAWAGVLDSIADLWK